MSLSLLALLACAPATLDWVLPGDSPAAADSGATDPGGDGGGGGDGGDTDVEDIPGNPDSDDATDALFDDAIIELQLIIPGDAWDELTRQSQEAQRIGAEYFDFEYVECTVVYDGVEYSPVGVRIKGQGSFQPIWIKPSLKLKFDLYDPELRFVGGLNRLTLNNMTNDYTMAHERLAYRVYREAGIPASRAGHGVLTLNDEPYGLYTVLETVDKDLIRHWYSDEGVLFEGWDVDLKSSYVDDFELEFGDEAWGRERLALAASALAIDGGSAALEAVDPYLDVDQFVRFWAAEAVIAQFDAYPYTSPGDDYFVYLDPETEQFDFMPWGNDESFSSPSGSVTSVYGVVAQKCSRSTACEERFTEQVWEVLTVAEAFDWLAWYDAVVADIQPHVEADTHKVYETRTVEQYQESMREFIEGRERKLEQQLGTRP